MEEENMQDSQVQNSQENQPITNEDILTVMNAELNRDPDLSDEERENLTNELLGMKEEYANGDNNQRASLESELIEKAQSMTMPEEFKKQIAETLTDAESFGHSPIDKLKSYAADFMGIIDGSNPVIYEKKKPGHKMHSGEWLSFDSINEMLSGMKVDQGSKEGMKILVDDVVRKAEEIQPGENSDFNYQKEYNNIKEKIVESGDLLSLSVDKIFGNRTFKDDLMSAIQKGTYAEMGISDNQVQDPTPGDGKITEEDAKIISEAVMQDENVLKDYLSEYYTKALEQNWNNNLSQEVRKNKK